LKVRVLLLIAFLFVAASAESTPSASDLIVENYCAATKRQAETMTGASMEVAIRGVIPKLKKVGQLQALRHITSLGRITYDALRFQGDDTVKRNVIAKYLQAEEQSQQEPSIAVTPENYKFKYKGKQLLDGREAHRFEVTPKNKRQGLFRGELWIDTETYLRVQEQGRLVKNPSMMLRKVEFVRKYEIRDGVSVPKQMQTIAQTWLVGKAELTIDYSNYSFEAKRASLGDGDNQ
jgi:hypothetical protein